MIRGTTPKHEFTLQFDTSLIKTIEITYAQCGKVVLKKGTADCEMSGSTVRVRLTQEETLKFDDKTYAEIQIRVLTTSGEVLASRKMSARVEAALSNEVLT